MMCLHRFTCARLALFLLVAVPAWTSPFTIIPTFDTTITSDPNAAAIEGVINAAIAIYEHDLLDPITVRITFQEGGGLGGSSSFYANLSYATYLAQLTADAKSSDDFTALAHLGTGPNNPVNGASTIDVKTANLRAIGIDFNVASDGTITLNTNLTDVGSPGTTGQYSLMAVAEHEIDEVLGFGSSLPSPPQGAPFPEDLFRYDGSGNRSFNTNDSSLAYFSIDGTTLLAQFHNVNDGADYGDWESSATPQVQDAYATPGSHPQLGVELRALDVIGFDLAAPEPATWLLTLAGLALAAFRKFR